MKNERIERCWEPINRPGLGIECLGPPIDKNVTVVPLSALKDEREQREAAEAKLAGANLIRDLERRLEESDGALKACEAMRGAEVPGGRHSAIAAAYKREREQREAAERALGGLVAALDRWSEGHDPDAFGLERATETARSCLTPENKAK